MNSPIAKFRASLHTLLAVVTWLLIFASLGVYRTVQIQKQQCKEQVDSELQSLQARVEDTSGKSTRLTEKIKTLKANGDWTPDLRDEARQESDALQKKWSDIKIEILRLRQTIASRCQ